MSLNGLDTARINEAYQAVAGEQGGWYAENAQIYVGADELVR